MKKTQSGQALVLVLLALAVVLTIVLFILSRSITDIAVSSSQSQAVSAFSAAEAGVEKALVLGSAPIGPQAVGSASYTASVTNVAQGSSSFVYPADLNSGDSMTLWLKSQDSTSLNFTGTNLKICWGKPGAYSDQNLKPAIEIVLFYETTADNPLTAKIFRTTADPFSGRPMPNSFSAATTGSCTISGQSFPFYATVSLTGLSNPQFAFVRMFYNNDTAQPIAFDSTDTHTFPTQGILVDSSGTAGGTSNAPQSTRKVQVFQGWPEIPNIFQFAVYSSTRLTK